MPGIKAVTIGRTARQSPAARQARRRSGLRKNSAAISVMLLAQYGLGMGVNLYARVPAADHATLGLGEFSHIEVVFCFHKETRARRGAAHPRGNPAWPKVGVLADHSPVRPNHLGVSRCALLHIDGLDLTVQGLDAIDGTPVLDIKPWATGFQPQGPVREPTWMRELMADYY